MTQYAGLKPEQTGVRLKYRQYLNHQGTQDGYQEMPQLMTSWGLILLGDAAFILRPHTAASTAKAGANALALGRALQKFPDDIDAALKEWEPDQLALGRNLERRGKALGNRSQYPRS